jgi:hypothetical protein
MKNMDELIRKYWKGTSEAEEEQILKKHFCETDNGQIDDAFFSYLNDKRKDKLTDPDFDKEILQLIKGKNDVKRSWFQKINWKIAAAIILLLSLAAIYFNRQWKIKGSVVSSDQIVIIDTYEDPQIAYEETKKALLLISSNLNKGKAYTTEFAKFNQSQENLKKNN